MNFVSRSRSLYSITPFLLLIIFLTLLPLSLSKKINFELLELHDDDFEDEITMGYWLVRFCSPKHPNCSSTNHVMSEIQQRPYISLLSLAQVNCEEYIDLCLDYGAGMKHPFYRLFLERKDVSQSHLTKSGAEHTAEKLWKWASYTIAGKVQHLTDDSFIETEFGDWLVIFYNSWDMHSRLILPRWKDYSLTNPDFHIAQVDCGKAKKICHDEEIAVTPTLKLFKADHVREFIADRNIAIFEDEWSIEKIDRWARDSRASFKKKNYDFSKEDSEKLDKVLQSRQQREEKVIAEADVQKENPTRKKTKSKSQAKKRDRDEF